MSPYRFMFVNLLDVKKRNRFMKEAEQINVGNLPSFAPGKKVSSKRALQGSSELDVPCDFSYRGVKKRRAE